jgi:hypothetical protein
VRPVHGEDIQRMKCVAVVTGQGPARTKGSPSAVSKPDGQRAARGAPLPRSWKGMKGQRQSLRLAEKNPRRSKRSADGVRNKPEVARRRGWPVKFSIVRYDMPNEFCMSASTLASGSVFTCNYSSTIIFRPINQIYMGIASERRFTKLIQ